MKARPLIVAFLIGLSVQPTHAQDIDPDEVAGAGFFEMGAHYVQLDDLNSRLEQLGYPTFERAMLAIGGGGYGVVAGYVMLGGEGYGLISGEHTYQDRSVTLGGGYGLFNIGYLHRLAPSLHVYPMLGLGGGGMTLEIGSTDAGLFDEVLEDPDRQARLSKGGMLISLGGGLEYRVGIEERGFLLGIRAGYLLAPFTSNWRLDGDVLGGGPDASFGGPFVRFLIGGF